METQKNTTTENTTTIAVSRLPENLGGNILNYILIAILAPFRLLVTALTLQGSKKSWLQNFLALFSIIAGLLIATYFVEVRESEIDKLLQAAIDEWNNADYNRPENPPFISDSDMTSEILQTAIKSAWTTWIIAVALTTDKVDDLIHRAVGLKKKQR